MLSIYTDSDGQSTEYAELEMTQSCYVDSGQLTIIMQLTTELWTECD